MKKQQGYVYIIRSQKDKEVKDEVVLILEQNGYMVWKEDEEMIPGTDWADVIDKSIRNATVTIALLTQNSVVSTWVIEEIKFAISLQKNVYPLLIDDNVDLPLILRNMNFLDFRKPRNDQQISRLLYSIRAPFEVFAKSEEALEKYQEDLSKGKQYPIKRVLQN